MQRAQIMTIRYFQKGFNYSQDGPGNRLVYHLQGCNWHCPWCSNPEGMDPARKAQVSELSAMVQEAVSCVPMMIEGGGVTLTGGEVLLQWEAVTQFLCELRAAGIHTAIESNLSIPRLDCLLPYLCFLMCDCKHHDSATLHRTTGGSLDGLRQNFSALAAHPVPTIVRIPLIHGFNDARQDIEGFIHLFKELPGKFSVEILPYHEYGKDKWKKLGLPYQMQDAFVSAQTLQSFEAAFRAAGFTVIHT